MGLFGGGKKPCPICGVPTGRFLATKVEGQALCADCGLKAGKLPGTVDAKDMTVEQVRAFIAFYDENAPLRDAFQETYTYDFGFLGGDIVLDVPQRLVKFSKSKDAAVFEASHITFFCISEDEVPLFEGSKDALTCCQSAVPDRVKNLGPEINRFLTEQRQYEQMERMDKMLEKQAKETGESYTPRCYFAPDADRLKPFEKFWLKIQLSCPDWGEVAYARGGPGFTNTNPSISAYLNEYEGRVTGLRELADQLMAVLSPDAPVRQTAAPAESGVRTAPAAPSDPVAEIQRYKALLDAGAITEEEFSAKKRQLLGI